VIRAAIDHLPETLRTAFVLRDVEELPMADVAEVLDIGLSATKMRVARAREQLRIALTGRI
jgi:RNA polymerase sigma-70 factor, ECF subfamily